MIILTDIKKLDLINPAVTVGTFDGVHKGHQSVIKKTIETARIHQGQSVVLTFWPHPRFVVKNGDFKLINSFNEKTELIRELGIDILLNIPFNNEFASLEAEDFVKNILINKLGTKSLVVGYDHQFGKAGSGQFDILKKLAKKFRFELLKVEASECDNQVVSSTIIRDFLNKGNVIEANRLLGYAYLLSGKVGKGLQIGRKLGYPTANIINIDRDKLVPGTGVYAVNILVGKELHKGMLSIGYRPSIKEAPNELSIEVHIFDFNMDIYNEEIRILFCKRLRDELKFDHLADLKNQMQLDEVKAREILKDCSHSYSI